MTVLRCCAPTLLLAALSATRTIYAGAPLPVTNPIFADVPVQCSVGYAYQGSSGATCTSGSVPEQAFNGTPGMGWVFTPTPKNHTGTGITDPNTVFDPPSFNGLPFSQAAFLQGPGSEVSQTISGFVAGQPYQLGFYLGPRQRSGTNDGRQTVAVVIDDHVIGTRFLVSFTPFVLQSIPFQVTTSGNHTLRFIGLNAGDHTAFFSDVTIEAVDAAGGK